LSIVVCTFFFSCQTKPESAPIPVEPAPVTAEEPPAAVEPAIIVEEPFNPQQVSQELFDSTLHDVQQFITSLNNIIRSQKYDDWIKNLSQEYIDAYSSPEYLRQASEDPRFKSQKIVLTSLRDYFVYNVVPSRANVVKIDDIEFITPTRVKAFTTSARGQRLRLYELEKNENKWKIIN
jgi:hypothetical protein